MPNWNNPYVPTAPTQMQPYTTTNGWPNYYSMANSQTPVYQQTQMPQMAYSSPVKTNIKWVSGRGEAESTPCGPNETILMLDSSMPKMYIKSAGPDGRVNPLMVCDYTVSEANFQNENSQTANAVDTSNFATKEDFNQLREMIEDLTKPGKKNG